MKAGGCLRGQTGTGLLRRKPSHQASSLPPWATIFVTPSTYGDPISVGEGANLRSQKIGINEQDILSFRHVQMIFLV